MTPIVLVSKNIDECEPRPCMNGGTCANLINAYSCSCPNGYSGKNCQVASLGVSCSQSGTTCADRNAGCQSNGQDGNTCQCTSSYYDSDGLNNIGGTCILKVGLGSNCPMPNACLSSRAECIGSRCSCTNTYYDTNTDNTIGGSCET
ncbi:delta-like protein A, partial [Ruditapes philippinarum]|uniref:delta-like protein A n=1 Tax=Ruditapes philippinarum TaxID=129788 RepID=UPI00295BF0B4